MPRDGRWLGAFGNAQLAALIAALTCRAKPATVKSAATQLDQHLVLAARHVGSGGSTTSLGGGSLSMGTTVLGAKAPVANAVSAAGVLIVWFIALFLSRYAADDAPAGRAIHRTTFDYNSATGAT